MYGEKSKYFEKCSRVIFVGRRQQKHSRKLASTLYLQIDSVHGVCSEQVRFAAAGCLVREELKRWRVSGSVGGVGGVGRGEQPVLCNQANQRMRLECLRKEEVCSEKFT